MKDTDEKREGAEAKKDGAISVCFFGGKYNIAVAQEAAQAMREQPDNAAPMTDEELEEIEAKPRPKDAI